MLPFLSIGSFTFATYPLVYFLAFMIGGTVALGRAGQVPGDPDRTRRIVLVVVAAILVGLYLPTYLIAQVVSLFTGQAAAAPVSRVYFGLGCGLLAAVFYARRLRLNLWPALDRCLPGFALGFALARWGCLAAGCCGGRITTSRFSLTLPNEAGVWAPRYPTQLLSSAIEFGLFLGMVWLQPRLRRDWPAGLLSLGYLFLFCLERFGLEFWREDYQPILGALSQPHLWMLAGMAASLTGLLWLAASAQAKPGEQPVGAASAR